MEHVIEHQTGVYVGLLLLACMVGVVTKWITHVPYTIALTLVGLLIALFHLGPDISETGFSRELIFFVLLPPLLFQGAMHLKLDLLARHFWPILVFSILGVGIQTAIIGGMYYTLAGVGSLAVAMLFGAMMSPTDPVSVLAIFRECRVPADLRYIVEGESLFNDGTGVVIFTIILGVITSGETVSIAALPLRFIAVTFGGLLLGTALGAVTFLLLRRLTDHVLENAICLVLAFGSFWLAEVLHVSGVIATVMAGLMIGNYGRKHSMSRKTVETVETFFEAIDFLINSILFILIGIELQTVTGHGLSANLTALLVAIAALLVARAAAVYPLYWLLNTKGTRRPRVWSHVLFWGGLRGSIPIALLLGLPAHPTIDRYRTTLLVSGFGLVFFSLVVQGLTMKPLLRWLGISATTA